MHAQAGRAASESGGAGNRLELPPPDAPPRFGIHVLREGTPFFKRRHLRWDRASLPERIGMDLVGMPLNVAWWDSTDWTFALLLGGATVGLMTQPQDSLDASIQRRIGSVRNGGTDLAFPYVTSLELAAGAATWVGAAALLGELADNDSLREYGSLTAEALIVTHAWHVTTKLMMGREDPDHGNGDGLVYGPQRGTEFFPSGTPSGHAATVCTMAAVAVGHFDNAAARTAGFAACAYTGASLIYNDQHFLSDVLWGAAMGYAIGDWVVRHRSTRYASLARRPGPRHEFYLLPFGTDPETGLGISLLMPFR